MSRFGRPERQLLWGLGAALLVGIGLLHLYFVRSEAAAAGELAARQAMIETRALAELVSRADGRGEAVPPLVAGFQASATRLRSIRVIAFDGLSLEASTVAADRDERAAPRRLVREEKPLYDQGQRLRAAVETNRQEAVARKDEVEVEVAGGALRLAAPVEVGGEVVGAVLAEAPAAKVVVRTTLLPAFLAVFLPWLALAVLAAFLAGRRRLLLVAAGLVLIVACVTYSERETARLASAREANEQGLAVEVANLGQRAVALAEGAGIAHDGLDAAAWDGDLYRQPRGVLDAAGQVRPAAVAAEVEHLRSQSHKTVVAMSLLALAVLAFVAFGAAARLFATLSRHRQAYLYTLPAMLGMVLLVFFPFAYGITLSFTDSTLYNTDKTMLEKWVGLANYGEILRDVSVVKKTEAGTAYNYENFYWTLGFTVVWTITNVAFGVTVGLILALILNTAGLKMRPIYRVLFILPWAVPNYITALIWKGMFHQQLGVINQVLQLVGGKAVSWFESPLTSFLAIWSTNGWLSFPFMMVISLGALQSIPAELYEAARVDGASRWQQFRSITLPSLRPALVPAVILSVVWTFNMFNIPYLTSAGEPAHATEILVTGAYKIAFEKYQYGYAAAYATIIFLILLAYGTWQNRVTKATESIG